MTVSYPRRILAVLGALVVAVVILAVGQDLWSLLVVLDLRTTPAMPWAAPAMLVVLALLWAYMRGKGWPQSTSEARRRGLRAFVVTPAIFAEALLAGVFGIIALSGLWIVGTQLIKMSPNAIPNPAGYPALTVAVLLLTSIVAAPFSEEPAFRGYLQTTLERYFAPVTAVAVSSLFFMLAHVTQGVFIPKMVVYYLAGALFGTIAFKTKSILPGIAVHVVADATFFLFVWPFDAARPQVWTTGPDAWFWVHVAQALIFGALTVIALRRLGRARGARSNPNLAAI